MKFVFDLLRRLKFCFAKVIWNHQNLHISSEDFFSKIYKDQVWGKDAEGGLYFSGAGSIGEKVEGYKIFLIDFIINNGIKSVFELGCGDFRVMRSVLNRVDVDYIGGDVVENLVTYLSDNNATQKYSFVHLDGTNDQLFPKADLCIIRQVLQHLSNSQIKKILRKTYKFRYVLITEHVPLNPKIKNQDLRMSADTRIRNKNISGVYVDSVPFSLESRVVYSYRYDDLKIPALIQTSLIENRMEGFVEFGIK